MNEHLEINATLERTSRELREEKANRVHEHGSFDDLISLANEQSEDDYHFNAIDTLKIAYSLSEDNIQAERAAYLIADNYLSVANDRTLDLELNREFLLSMADEADKWQKTSESYSEEPIAIVEEPEPHATEIIEVVYEENSLSSPKYTFVEKIVEKAAKKIYLAKFGLELVVEKRREAKRKRSLGGLATRFAFA